MMAWQRMQNDDNDVCGTVFSSTTMAININFKHWHKAIYLLKGYTGINVTSIFDWCPFYFKRVKRKFNVNRILSKSLLLLLQ